MPIRASAGESQPARSVSCRSLWGKANRICNLSFDAEVGTGDAMAVGVGTGLLRLVVGFMCGFSRVN